MKSPYDGPTAFRKSSAVPKCISTEEEKAQPEMTSQAHEQSFKPQYYAIFLGKKLPASEVERPQHLDIVTYFFPRWDDLLKTKICLYKYPLRCFMLTFYHYIYSRKAPRES